MKRFCIRCAICKALAGLCNCKEELSTSTTVDAGPFDVPDFVEDVELETPPPGPFRVKFERFCDDNPDHHDCRIYD